ncbi:hypothetical protein EMMF5_002302 [Cystobasidiomycetes sp. EMM_F5]
MQSSTLPAGAAYGAPASQDPYATHSSTGTHHGVTGSHAHNAPVAHQTDTVGGVHNQHTGTTGTGILGHDKHVDTRTHDEKGFLGRKKDDIEDSLAREREAKAELDRAMAKHNAARTDAHGKLQAREEAARVEFEQAQARLQEAQQARSQFGQ